MREKGLDPDADRKQRTDFTRPILVSLHDLRRAGTVEKIGNYPVDVRQPDNSQCIALTQTKSAEPCADWISTRAQMTSISKNPARGAAFIALSYSKHFPRSLPTYVVNTTQRSQYEIDDSPRKRRWTDHAAVILDAD